ncbi:hypothetical protein Goarm_005329 [Gossypium armourianum]|uniref:Uncharacterized protein n=1 Tax=Gossypium armourianum TaxID=34283 RepID=A0A7J9JZP2_9ROSI|nr:hypothetical protein [Gossypium armourianum]
MLSILPPTLRKSLGRPTGVRKKEPDKPQTTTKLTKKMVRRHKVGVHNQVVALTRQKAAPTHQEAATPREKLPCKRKLTTVRWMPSTQESSVSDPLMTL